MTGVLVGGAAPVLVPAGLVVRAVGHRGQPLPDLPFDEATGTVPSDRGRVVDPATGAPVPGTYVVGWAKRGASGGIGTNRTDAEETVDVLLDDLAAGRLAPPARSARQFARLVRSRTRRGTWLPFPAARVTA